MPFELPASAVEGVALLLSILAVVFTAGKVGNVLTELLKRIEAKLFHGDAFDEVKLGGLLAEVVVLIISSVAAYVGLNYLTPIAEFLDSRGIWAIIVSAWPVAWYYYKETKKYK